MGLSARSRQEGDEVEQAAIGRAAFSIFSTRWAAESAARDYGADPSKIAIAPFGATLDFVPPREEAIAVRPRDTLRLFFQGNSWERKGGDIALDTLQRLRAVGLPATLTVSGCAPPVRAPGLRVIPTLDMRKPEDRLQLSRQFAQAHLLFLPTRGDRSPVAFSEAAAHGLPVVSTRTGGVPDIVDVETGILCPLAAGGAEYAREIAALWHDPERMARMRAAARARYDAQLNWGAWARKVGPLLRRATLTLAPAARA